jgi:PhnB protein
MAGTPLRKGFHTVTPYLVVDDIQREAEFLKQAFDAVETERVRGGSGGWHGEMKIGDSMIMMGQGPAGTAVTSAQIFLYVEDPDALYRRALKAGATSKSEPSDQSYGRSAGVTDPCGQVWWLCRHAEE